MTSTRLCHNCAKCLLEISYILVILSEHKTATSTEIYNPIYIIYNNVVKSNAKSSFQISPNNRNNLHAIVIEKSYDIR